MPDLEIYPDEKNRIVSAWAAIQTKWIGKPDTHENMVAMATEAENRFRELGFKVIVDISNIEMGDDGNAYLSPVISIEDRIVGENSGHDFDRHAFEVQHGYEDGVEGKVNANGKISEIMGRN
jgi:hypothetical protein